MVFLQWQVKIRKCIIHKSFVMFLEIQVLWASLVKYCLFTKKSSSFQWCTSLSKWFNNETNNYLQLKMFKNQKLRNKYLQSYTHWTSSWPLPSHKNRNEKNNQVPPGHPTNTTKSDKWKKLETVRQSFKKMQRCAYLQPPNHSTSWKTGCSKEKKLIVPAEPNSWNFHPSIVGTETECRIYAFI